MQKEPSKTSAETPGKRGKKPPEKRLFHKPVTPGKIAIYALLVVLLAGLVIALRFVYVTLIDARAAFKDTPSPSPVVTATPQPSSAEATPQPTQTLSPEELLAQEVDKDFMKDRVNILLTGIDYSAEREGRTDFRTDTIMLFSVNFSTGKVDILSVPRDSYADIAFTDRKWKINGAFMSAGGAEGKGYECLLKTISDTIGGIPINYYISVEMQAVKDIVDIIGGVWYDVDYEINLDGRHLDKGYQLLNGQAVLDYCRARKGITSGKDIDRIDRQQRLLMEVFRQLKESDMLAEIPQIYDKMKDQINTNLSFEQIAALAFFGLDLDPDTGLTRHTLQGEYMVAYGSNYYVIDHKSTVNIIKEIFGVDVSDTINWKYSLDFVKNDNAKIVLSDAISKLQECLDQKRDTLSEDLIRQAEELLNSADDCLNAANTDDMTDMAALLETMYKTLSEYVPPAATPEPTPEITPTPEVTPSSEAA